MIYVNLTSDTWNNLYSLTGITVGQSFSIQAQSGTRLVLSDAAVQPNANDANGVEVLEGDWYTFNSSAQGAWALPTGGGAVIAIAPAYSKLTPHGYPSRAILYGNTIDRIATQALNYRDDAISRGLGYYSYNNQTIAAGAKTWARFICPADKYVVLIARQIITDNVGLRYRAYTAWSGGTVDAAIPIKNLRNDTAYPSTTQINVITGTPTPTAGTDVTNLPVYGAEAAGNRVSGGTDSADTFRLLAPNSSFLIEWENTSATANDVFTQFTWFELSTQVIL